MNAVMNRDKLLPFERWLPPEVGEPAAVVGPLIDGKRRFDHPTAVV